MKEIVMNGGLRVAVDDEDFFWLNQYKWIKAECKTGVYARACKVIRGKQVTLLMHRLIMNPPGDMVVDHINRNPLDNRKSNLRVCSRRENNRNRIGNRNSSSKYKGVSKFKKGWQAYISDLNGNKKHLGTFKCEHQAAKAYNKEAQIMFGDFCLLNQIEPER